MKNQMKCFCTIRRTAKISQMVFTERSGASLGTIKRFERVGNISLESLIKLSQVLGYENDINKLFNYQKIFDVIKEGVLKI